MSCKGPDKKRGDSIPLEGRIVVQEWDEDNNEYVDVSANFDFSLWSIEAEVKNLSGTTIADFEPVIGAGGIYTGMLSSSVTGALPAGKYRYDVRYKDENGQVQSSPTYTFELGEAVSETPA